MFWGKFRAVPKQSQMHPNGKKRTKTWVSVPMVWIGSVSCEKFEKDIMARTFSLIALVWCVLQHVSCSSKTVPNAPKRKETHQNMSLGSNGVDRERRCEKFRLDFVAQTFALIAPIWHVLQQVSCSRETVPNAPKQIEMHQNMSLGSIGVDQERSLWKILTRHRGKNFCINCTSLACFRAIAKRCQMHPNGKKPPNHEFRVQWCVSWAFVVKNWTLH